jgi:hypothetical protein
MEFSFPLKEERQHDLLWTLHFYAWWLCKQQTNAADAEAAMAQFQKVDKASLNQPYKQSFDEFALLYRAAQWTLKGLSTGAGDEYLEEIVGDEESAQSKSEKRDYLIKTCLILVNECNRNFAELPEFVSMRNKLEEEMRSAK